MPQRKATDEISDKARLVMVRGFAQGWPATRIVQAVLDETGETLAPRTVTRRAAEWRSDRDRRQSAQERMEDLVAAMKAGGMDGSEMIQALAINHLVEHPEALTGADPIDLHGLSMDAEKVRLKKRELDIRERAVAVNEKKLQLLEDREARALAALKSDKPELTAEDRIREIREIYGLKEAS